MAYQEVKVQQPLLLTILPVMSLAAFFLGWQAVVVYGIVPNELLASPTQVFQAFLAKLHDPMPDGAVLSIHIWTSIKEAFLGYSLSLLVGIPLGLAMGWFRVVEGLVRPIFELIRPIPPIAWIPLTVFWFGIDLTGKVFTGLCIPSALPMVFGALQIALAYCWTNLVGAELLAADTGLGYLITMGGRLIRPDIVLLGMICVGLSGALIGVIIDYVEKTLLAGIRR